MSQISAYSFRAATRADLPLFRRWLHSPEVVRWWGDPDEQYALLQEDLGEPLMTMRVVLLDGRAFAYAQHYEVHSWPQAHLAHFPRGSRAIDAFVGEPELVGRGHGSIFLRLLARQLRDGGAPGVVIDPDASNERARRAYARAGFRGDTIVEAAEGPVVVMTFDEG